MEVSSHALEQQRVFGIPFDVAVFTNLTRDHLDYHQTMERYFDSKGILFRGCGTEPPRVAVLNIEDEYGAKLAQASKSELRITYGIAAGDFRADKVDTGRNGTRFDIVMPAGTIPNLVAAGGAGERVQHSGGGRGCLWARLLRAGHREGRGRAHQRAGTL